MVTRVNRVFITKENPASVLLVIAHSPLSGKRESAAGNLKTPKGPVNLAINPFAVAFGGSLGASLAFSRHSSFHAGPCKFSPPVAALETGGRQ